MAGSSKPGKPRTVIIGIDGAPFGLMDKLSKGAKSVMPNFSGLKRDGIFVKMESSIPEISSVSWSSVITGKNPGGHGIFGFTDIVPGTYRLSFPNFTDLRAPAFWQKDNRRYAIMNVPATYPVHELNGFLVSGFVSPDLNRATYPASYIPKLREMGYQIDVDASKGHQSKSLLLDELFRVHGIRMKAVRYFWEEIKWDVFMIVFTGTDRLGHFLWDAYENKNHEHHQRFLDYFAEIDKSVGEISSMMKPDDRLLMCSDHGMELAEASINVNKVLQENGFLKLGNNPSLQYNNIRDGTKAFAMDPGRIYINRAGKYPRGFVKPGEEEKTAEELARLFKNMKISGKKVMKVVYRKDEIYSGPCIGSAPDIVLLGNKGINLKASLAEATGEPASTKGILTGKHSHDDAFMLLKGMENMEVVPENPKVEDIENVLRRLK